MRSVLFFLLCLFTTSCFSQQFREYEFYSKEQKQYTGVLKKNRIKKICSFYQGNVTEIKRYLPNNCPDSWRKFSYNSNRYLQEKLYPHYACGEKGTLNNNRYVYLCNTKKQLSGIEHTNTGQARGKILYTYNAAGLLIYTEPDDDFGYYDTSFTYEFYTN